MIITVTLTAEALPGLRPALTTLGWQVRERPLLRYAAPRSWADLDRALLRREQFRAVAFTSPRGAAAFAGRCSVLGIPAETIPEIWALGPQTAAALPAGIIARTPAAPSGGSALAEAMLSGGVSGPVLHCCSRERREELGLRLRKAGVPVEEAICYEVALAGDVEVAESLRATDLIVIGSHRLIERAARVQEGKRPGLICLGPATAATARAAGWEPAAVAAAPTAGEVARAIGALVSAA